MKSLSIDIETYGSVDLTKSGVYAYANAPVLKSCYLRMRLMMKK